MNRMIGFLPGIAMLISFAGAVEAQDPAPRDVRDLEGMRASSIDSVLQSRGYEFYQSSRGAGRIYANWWNPKTRTCINVVTLEGYIDLVSTAPEFDCGIDGNASGEAEKIGSQYGDKWYDDYIGDNPGSTENEFERRGYRRIDTQRDGDRYYTWFWQRENNRCFKMTVEDGVVYNIRADRGACR